MLSTSIDLSQVREVQPMPGGEPRQRFVYRDGKRTDEPVTRDGSPVYRLSALAVLPMLGYQAITVETTTPPFELIYEALPTTRLLLSGAGEMTVRGADFGQLSIVLFAESVSVAGQHRGGGDHA
ncbi:MAG: hypothetical protein E7L00_04690 [Propionibacteriaceae bacterium]|nr:hypothetical protein [Propionibacteriaceae bacterium]